MGLLKDCERTVQESIDALGGLDIIVSNAVSSLSEISNPKAFESLGRNIFNISDVEIGLD